MSVFRIILRNLIGFDSIIFLAAGLNVWCCLLVRRRAISLYEKLHPFVFLPTANRDPDKLRTEVAEPDLEGLVKLRTAAERLYALFVTLTSIFPLLGILGTVLSLLPMVSDLGNLQTNFFAALTSTFWGLIFSIAFKLCDGYLSFYMEDNDKNLTLLLERHRQDAEVSVP